MEEQTTMIEEQTQIEAPAPARVPLRDLEDGQRVDGRLRGPRPRAAPQAQRRALAEADAGRRHRHRRGGRLGGRRGALRRRRAGSPVLRPGCFEVSDRWGAKIKLTDLREAVADEYETDDLADRLRRPLRPAGGRPPRSCSTRSRAPSCASCSTASSARAPRSGRASATRRRRRSTTRPTATACSSTRSRSPRRSRAAATFFPGIDRDVAVAGALLHDIGKTEAYNDDPLAIDLTDPGRLQGEIPLGYYLVRRQIEDIPGFDPALAQAVLHIILSHHGSLEHGSPVVPCTREAVLVHMIDNLGGRLGSFDRLERELPAGEAWSSFDRALSGSAYFGQRRRRTERAADARS